MSKVDCLTCKWAVAEHTLSGHQLLCTLRRVPVPGVKCYDHNDPSTRSGLAAHEKKHEFFEREEFQIC